MSRIVVKDQPCPVHGSSDSVQIYQDGSAHCFNPTCEKHWGPGSYDFDTGELTNKRGYKRLDDDDDNKYVVQESSDKIKRRSSYDDDPQDIVDKIFDVYQTDNYEYRGVSEAVIDFYKCRISYNSDGTQKAIYYAYDLDSSLHPQGYKRRTLPKDFSGGSVGTVSSTFGRGLFSGGKRIILTEGEDDAMVIQEAYFRKYKRMYPVQSLRSSTGVKDLIEEREEFRKFDDIVLWLDNDAAGEKAMQEAAKILGYDKVKVVKCGHKDAGDVVSSEGIEKVLGYVYDAIEYSPAAILNGADLWERVVNYNAKPSISYPAFMSGLNDKLKGIRFGEITLWVSGTGSGKSSLMREIMLHLSDISNLIEEGEEFIGSESYEKLIKIAPDMEDYVWEAVPRIGVVTLEEGPEETARKVAGMAIMRNPSKEDIPIEDLKVGFDKVFGGGNVLVLDHQGSIKDGSVMDHIEYMCLKGCKWIFVDHITILVSEGVDGLTGNEAIDKIMNDLAGLVKKYDVWIGLVSHLRKSPNDKKSFEEGRMPTLDDIKGCLAYDTEVLLYSGEKRKVQDVKEGDLLMGPDSLPRKVLQTRRGQQNMYKVTNKTSRDYFVCNEDHVLTLSKNDKMFDITVKSFLGKSSSFQYRCKQHFSEGYELDHKEMCIPPYSLGAWLGDGSKSAFRIIDASGLGVVQRVSRELNSKLKPPKNKNREYFNFVTDERGDLLGRLKKLGLLNNKHIPKGYKINSQFVRLQLLAGLIDTDGTYSKKDQCFYFYQKDISLAEDVRDIARSLGFYSTSRPQTITSRYASNGSTIYQVTISGDIRRIPCQKQVEIPTIVRTNNPLKRGIVIQPLDIQDYYGFTLDGDGRFLLGNHIITHNSGSIKQISYDVIGFSRNQNHEDEDKRNTVRTAVLKCRYTGLTGPSGNFHYDFPTGRMSIGLPDEAFSGEEGGFLVVE